jgi:transposase-like protein
LALQLGINPNSILQWIKTYQSLGPEGLKETSKYMRYSSELKKAAVMDYLSGNGSYMELCKKYGIKSTRQLRYWVLLYNGHEKIITSGTGGRRSMTKGRKTTFEEKILIVKYCIEHQNNYFETALKYQVSYYQIHSWVKKYEKYGVEALQDNRGKRKSVDKMSEVEKLRAQNKLLEAENKRKQMEIDFLKKLDEIERRRY